MNNMRKESSNCFIMDSIPQLLKKLVGACEQLLLLAKVQPSL